MSSHRRVEMQSKKKDLENPVEWTICSDPKKNSIKGAELRGTRRLK